MPPPPMGKQGLVDCDCHCTLKLCASQVENILKYSSNSLPSTPVPQSLYVPRSWTDVPLARIPFVGNDASGTWIVRHSPSLGTRRNQSISRMLCSTIATTTVCLHLFVKRKPVAPSMERIDTLRLRNHDQEAEALGSRSNGDVCRVNWNGVHKQKIADLRGPQEGH